MHVIIAAYGVHPASHPPGTVSSLSMTLNWISGVESSGTWNMLILTLFYMQCISENYH